jgi:hypothetical protein
LNTHIKSSKLDLALFYFSEQKPVADPNINNDPFKGLQDPSKGFPNRPTTIQQMMSVERMNPNIHRRLLVQMASDWIASDPIVSDWIVSDWIVSDQTVSDLFPVLEILRSRQSSGREK